MGLLRSDNKLYAPVSASFDTQTGLIHAHIDKVDYGFVDQPVRYHGKTFQPKNELHITLVNQDAGTILKHMESHPYDLNDIQDMVFSADFSFFRRAEFYYVEERPGVETIIQMVEVPRLRVFLMDLSKLIGRGLLLPHTHVTLYTRGTEIGISLPDQHTFQQLARIQILPAEVQLAKGSSNRSGIDQGLA
jgi:hypothetical protein